MSRNTAFIIITLVFACIGFIGSCMKVMHWPYGGLLFYGGFIGMVLAPALQGFLQWCDKRKK